MKTSVHARGRPKGTGIDDEVLLRDIARLCLADPELRPTTAIKRLGHTNPSTIRRVRDKFKARGEQIMVSLKRQASELKAAEKAEVVRVSRAKRANAAMKAEPAKSGAARMPSASSGRTDRGGIDGMETWVDCAGQCTALMLGSQLALAKCAIEHPAVTWVLRHQTQAINAMVAFCVIPPSGIGRLREATG